MTFVTAEKTATYACCVALVSSCSLCSDGGRVRTAGDNSFYSFIYSLPIQQDCVLPVISAKLYSTCAVIGQFAGRTLLYGPLRFEVGFVAKLFCNLSPSVLNFYSKLKLKLSFTLLRFQIDSFCFRGASEI